MCGSRLRRTSRLTVAGLRPSWRATERIELPARQRSAIITRSSSVKNRGEMVGACSVIGG